MTIFLVVAAAMILLALGLLLVPLVRRGQRTGRSRGVFALAIAIAFALPLAATGVYFLVGTPVALNGTTEQDGPPLTMKQALAELESHLAANPDDVRGWMLLAQTRAMQKNSAAARDAYGQVLKLSANNAEAMVGWVEADANGRPDHKIEGRALTLLKRAVLLQPDSQRGLWLLGISAFQHERYRDAAATWRLLQPQLEPGSEVATAVRKQIAVADARAGGSPTSAASSGATEVAKGPQLQVEVSLAPALKDQLAPGDTLFVYARAPNGPPMPLAVAKLDASQLPTRVTLNDAMAMTPGRTLSSVPRVFVGARISLNGQPLARKGDLEGDAGVVAVDRSKPIVITIDKVHK